MTSASGTSCLRVGSWSKELWLTGDKELTRNISFQEFSNAVWIVVTVLLCSVEKVPFGGKCHRVSEWNSKKKSRDDVATQMDTNLQLFGFSVTHVRHVSLILSLFFTYFAQNYFWHHSLSLSLSYLSQSVSPTTHSLHIVFLHSLVYHPLSLSLIVTVVVKYSLSSNLSSRSHVRTRVKVLSCAALSNCHTHVHVCAPAADEADAVASDAFQVYTLKP